MLETMQIYIYSQFDLLWWNNNGKCSVVLNGKMCIWLSFKLICSKCIIITIIIIVVVVVVADLALVTCIA